ncbi:TPA: hypothetical protein DF272_02310 [Candidatus Falkowbacteria bacterium]|nr:hypothetical protein [Candidatus Falkowbacteria bacterium]
MAYEVSAVSTLGNNHEHRENSTEKITKPEAGLERDILALNQKVEAEFRRVKQALDRVVAGSLVEIAPSQPRADVVFDSIRQDLESMKQSMTDITAMKSPDVLAAQLTEINQKLAEYSGWQEQQAEAAAALSWELENQQTKIADLEVALESERQRNFFVRPFREKNRQRLAAAIDEANKVKTALYARRQEIKHQIHQLQDSLYELDNLRRDFAPQTLKLSLEQVKQNYLELQSKLTSSEAKQQMNQYLIENEVRPDLDRAVADGEITEAAASEFIQLLSAEVVQGFTNLVFGMSREVGDEIQHRNERFRRLEQKKPTYIFETLRAKISDQSRGVAPDAYFNPIIAYFLRNLYRRHTSELSSSAAVLSQTGWITYDHIVDDADRGFDFELDNQSVLPAARSLVQSEGLIRLRSVGRFLIDSGVLTPAEFEAERQKMYREILDHNLSPEPSDDKYDEINRGAKKLEELSDVRLVPELLTKIQDQAYDSKDPIHDHCLGKLTDLFSSLLGSAKPEEVSAVMQKLEPQQRELISLIMDKTSFAHTFGKIRNVVRHGGEVLAKEKRFRSLKELGWETPDLFALYEMRLARGRDLNLLVKSANDLGENPKEVITAQLGTIKRKWFNLSDVDRRQAVELLAPILGEKPKDLFLTFVHDRFKPAESPTDKDPLVAYLATMHEYDELLAVIELFDQDKENFILRNLSVIVERMVLTHVRPETQKRAIIRIGQDLGWSEAQAIAICLPQILQSQLKFERNTVKSKGVQEYLKFFIAGQDYGELVAKLLGFHLQVEAENLDRATRMAAAVDTPEMVEAKIKQASGLAMLAIDGAEQFTGRLVAEYRGGREDDEVVSRLMSLYSFLRDFESRQNHHEYTTKLEAIVVGGKISGLQSMYESVSANFQQMVNEAPRLFADVADREMWIELVGPDRIKEFLDRLPKSSDEKRNALTHNQYDRTSIFLSSLMSNLKFSPLFEGESEVVLDQDDFSVISSFVEKFGLSNTPLLFRYFRNLVRLEKSGTPLPAEQVAEGIISLEVLDQKMRKIKSSLLSSKPIMDIDINQMTAVELEMFSFLTGKSRHRFDSGRPSLEQIIRDWQSNREAGSVAEKPDAYGEFTETIPRVKIIFDKEKVRSSFEIIQQDILAAMKDSADISSVTPRAQAVLNQKISDLREILARKPDNKFIAQQLSHYEMMAGRVNSAADIDSLIEVLVLAERGFAAKSELSSIIRELLFRKLFTVNFSGDAIRQMAATVDGDVTGVGILNVINLVDRFVKDHVLNLAKHNEENYWSAGAWRAINDAKDNSKQVDVTKIFKTELDVLRAEVGNFILEDSDKPVEVKMIPDRGLVGEMSGYLADVCYTKEYPLLTAYPNMVPYKFVAEDKASKERSLVGSVLVFELTAKDGDKVMLVRGFDVPNESDFDIGTFIEKFLDNLEPVARQRGINKILVPGSSGAISNYGMTLSYIQSKFINDKSPVSLDGFFNFNGYNLTDNCYLARTIEIK